MQVIYVRIEDIITARMAEHVPLPTRLAMHSANCELNKLLCVMASARAGYHIEELTQVGYDAVGFTGAQLVAVHDTCALTYAHLISHADKRHAMRASLSSTQSAGSQVLDMGGLTPLQLIRQICSRVGTPQIKLLNEYFPETLGKAGRLPTARAQCNVWRPQCLNQHLAS